MHELSLEGDLIFITNTITLERAWIISNISSVLAQIVILCSFAWREEFWYRLYTHFSRAKILM